MSGSSDRSSILVVGLGNVLLMDDGVGVHAVRVLEKEPPDGAIITEVGTAVLDALDLLERANRMIAIDAMEAGDRPGTVYLCQASDLEDRGVGSSMHQLDLAGAFRLLPGRRRPEIVMVGIEPERIDYGMELTPPVRASLPLVCRTVREIMDVLKTPTPIDLDRLAKTLSRGVRVF